MAINLGRLFFHWVKFAVFLCKNSPYSELFWSAFFSHFSAFGLNTERYFVSLCIQCECEKNVDQNNSEYGHFLRSGFLAKIQRSSICSWRDHSLSSGISTDTLCSSNVVLMDNLRPPASHSVCLFGVFLVRIFPHSDSIKFPVISPNARKYGWEKFQIRTLLTQYQSHQIQWNLAKLHKNSQRSLLKKQVQKLILYPNQFFWLESHRWGCWIV